MDTIKMVIRRVGHVSNGDVSDIVFWVAQRVIMETF